MLFKRLLLLSLCFLLSLGVFAETGSLLILHTNDIHDHIRPATDGIGGLPYVAGHIAAVRSIRQDVLVLDAGDILEKGDIIANITEGRIMYEAIGKIGYHAVTLGNHDRSHNVEHLRECGELTKGTAILCLNYLDADKQPYFPGSKLFELPTMKVGVIGLTNLNATPGFTLRMCAERLSAEARRLKEEAALVVAVVHMGSGECKNLSALAPEVDVFVSGHTHEVLNEPVVVRNDGHSALIVQAGSYAKYVGHLELSVDIENKIITDYKGFLVAMNHETIVPDTVMAAWIKSQEEELCPFANEIVGKANRTISTVEMGRLAASALRSYADADIGFCHPGRIMRSSLPSGAVSSNNLFLTGGQRGKELVISRLSGKQIETYLVGLVEARNGKTEWAGFNGELSYDGKTKRWAIKSDLKPDVLYRVVMPKQEWEFRLKKELDTQSIAVEEADFTFLEAVTAYVRQFSAEGETVEEHIEKLVAQRRGA